MPARLPSPASTLLTLGAGSGAGPWAEAGTITGARGGSDVSAQTSTQTRPSHPSGRPGTVLGPTCITIRRMVINATNTCAGRRSRACECGHMRYSAGRSQEATGGDHGAWAPVAPFAVVSACILTLLTILWCGGRPSQRVGVAARPFAILARRQTPPHRCREHTVSVSGHARESIANTNVTAMCRRQRSRSVFRPWRARASWRRCDRAARAGKFMSI